MRKTWILLLALLVGCSAAESGSNSQDANGTSAGNADGTDGWTSVVGTDGTDGADGTDATDGTDAIDGADATDGTDKKPTVKCPPAINSRPAAISEHFGVWDPIKKRIVFAGGNPEFPVQCIGKNSYLDGTWAYWPSCQQWQKLPAGPSPRGRSSAIYNSQHHAMIVFGGRYRAKGADPFSTPYTLYNETWWLDLTTDTWSEVQAKGDIPSGRVNASTIYDPKGTRMIMFGGNKSTNGASYIPLSDVHELDLKNDTWTKLKPVNTGPTARLFAAPVYDEKRHAMVLTAGGDAKAFTGPFLGDTWSLNLDTLEWTQLHNGQGTAPKRRIWGKAVMHDGLDSMILFGGHDDGSLGNRNDLWMFNLETNEWTTVALNDTWNAPSNGFCDFPSNFANIVEGVPERRGSHLFLIDPDTDTLYLHGGKTDCGQIDDVWSYKVDTKVWTDLEPASVGEVCLRIANAEDCNSLCN